MNIEFERTADDFVVFNLFHMTHSPSLKQQLIAMQILTALLCVAVVFIMYYAFNWEHTAFTYVVNIFVAVGAFFLYPFANRKIIKNTVRKMYTEGDNKALLGKQTITLSPEGIFSKTEATETKLIWASVARVMQSDEHIFVYIGSVNALVIPKTAFVSEKDQQEFLDYIDAHCEQKKADLLAA